MIKEILIEQVNVSDDEYRLVKLSCNSGDKVEKGENLFSYESSKAIFDFEADENGYIYLNPNLKIDESYKVGHKIAVISESKLSSKEVDNNFQTNEKSNSNKDHVTNFTKKAAKLFEESDLDISQFEGMSIVTEENILDAIESKQSLKNRKKPQPELKVDNTSLIIFGIGSQAEVAFDQLCEVNNYNVIAFADYGNSLDEKENLPVISEEQFFKIINKDNINVYICVPDQDKEAEILSLVNNSKSKLINIFANSAVISSSAIIGQNVFVGPNCVVGPYAEIQDSVRMLNNSSVAHHSIIGAHSWISDGARIGGTVKVGKKCLIGLNSSINKKTVIGDSCIVNSNVAVISDHKSGTFIK